MSGLRRSARASRKKKQRSVSCAACGSRAALRRWGYELCMSCMLITDRAKLEAAAAEWALLNSN